MNFKKLFKKIKKNLLVGFYGSIVGMIFSVFYLIKVWLPLNSNEIGLAIIAVLPVMIVLFSIGGIFIGGILAIIIYQIMRLFSSNKNTRLK